MSHRLESIIQSFFIWHMKLYKERQSNGGSQRPLYSDITFHIMHVCTCVNSGLMVVLEKRSGGHQNMRIHHLGIMNCNFP